MQPRGPAWLAPAVAAPWLVWAAARITGVELPYPLVGALAFTPYVALTSALPVVVALVLRRWAVAGAALVAAVTLAVLIAPRALKDGDPATTFASGGSRVTVLSVNTLLGRADAAAVMRIVRDRDVDVLSVQEVRPAWIARLDAAGAARRLPGRVLAFEDVALLTRREVRAVGPRTGAVGDVTLPGAGRTVRVTAVHPSPPVSRAAVGPWRAELAALPRAGEGEPLSILAGDFNATLDHPELRDVLARGYRDVAATRGAGWRTTWPAGRRFPPEITIDHVLVDERIASVSYSVYAIPGSDHRAVLAVVSVP